MRRITAHAVVAVVVGGLLSPVVAIATGMAASADSNGAETTVVGGGRGLSGPASRALLDGPLRMDGAPDGSVLATDGSQVLRVQPDSDTVAVVPGTRLASGDPGIYDVAAAGSAVLYVNAAGVHRAASDGTTTLLMARSDVDAVDVGADGVVWVATTHDVLRILPDGTVRTVTSPTSNFGYALDLTVTPDGSAAYVLDDGVGRYGVYQVSASGIGARVAGDLMRDDGLKAGVSAATASTEAVASLTTDGTTITLASPEYQRVMGFAVGGVLTQVVSGLCSQSITLRGSDLIVYCHNTANYAPSSVHMFSSTGVDLGRILGEDPDAPWSPDGVRATDAFTDTVRGAAGLPDGRIVFTTQHGLVREVGTDGLLRTRAILAPIANRGKVALGSDGTAYVVTDAGGIVKVPASGPAVPLTIDSDATDVEVQSDGTLVVADARGHRLLRVAADGSAPTVLTDALGTPSDIGLDGDTVLVADNGLRQVSAAGDVATLLSGGSPTTAAASPAGVWTTGFQPSPSWLYVLLPGGGLSPVRSDDAPRAQIQAVADGDVLISGGTSVRLVTDPGLPAAVPDTTLTATPGSGRVLLGWDGRMSVTVVAKPGAVPPNDFWDGVPVAFSTIGDPTAADAQHVVLRVGDHVLQAGEQWSFAAFSTLSAPFGDNGSVTGWSAGATATSTVLPDTTPPPVTTPVVNITKTAISLSWDDRQQDDLDHTVLRMTPGIEPPATPDDGTEIAPAYPGWYVSAQVPNPVPDQDYALSLFAVDLHGNYSRWTGVMRLDTTPPAQVTDLQVKPSYKYATFSFTPPPDSDYAFVRYAAAAGSVTPSIQNSTSVSGSTATAWNLTMGNDYTLAIWSVDKNGNVSEPTVAHFTALLDTTPPGPVTNLSATGGDYQVTATWTPPTDSDLDKLSVRLTDLSIGPGTTVTLPKTATTYTWPHLPGSHSYTVSVMATDVNGLTSDTSTASVDTNPDANGTPPPVDPSTVTVTPRSSTSVSVSFAKPPVPDLRNISYAAVPLGQDPTIATPAAIMTTTPIGDNLIGVVSLPQPLTTYQLVLFVYDFNGNRARSVGPQVKGVPAVSELPVAPLVLPRSPADNALSVGWASFDPLGARAATWTVTATSGSLSRTVTVPGATWHADLTDLVGRRDWTVTVTGTNPLGSGPTVTTTPVTVADSTPPAPVTGATRTPAADTEMLTWVNPTAFDFDHVVVTRLGATPAETQVVYQGAGTTARATGLLPGRAYSFEIRAYDRLGNVAPTPVTLTTIQPVLTLNGPASLVYGASATLTGSLSWNGTHPAGRTVSIQALPHGSTVWTQIATPATAATGTFAVTIRPSLNVSYRVGYAGSGGMGGAYSPARPVTVAPTVSIQSNVTSLRLGGTVTVTTTVAPRHAGGAVVLERWTGSTWSIVTWRTLSGVSTAAATVRPPTRGINTYRWVTPSDPAHASRASASRQVRVY